MWETSLDEAQQDFTKAKDRHKENMVKYQADLEAWKKRDKTQGHSQSKKATGKKEKPTPPKKPIPRMQENEPYNFLRFATALK